MPELNRRSLIKGAVVGAGAFALGRQAIGAGAAESGAPLNLKGRVNHSVARWTYGDLDIEALCKLVKSIGFTAIDLVGPDDWPVLKRYGIESSMCNGAELNLEDGWIHPEHHDELEARYRKHIRLVAEAGYTNLICFSGNARGVDRKTGLNHAVEGLRRILPDAERHGVVIHMELFNSKIDHPDYMADNSAWGVELCKALGSDHFKLLYDIYHMQISEGDIIRTIGEHLTYFGHFHTAGVPGRHEIDDTQELNYPAIAKAIADTGFAGYISQEFIPTAKTQAGKAAALRDAVRRCDV